MNNVSIPLLFTKITAVVAMCCVLSSCEFFCTCAMVLVADRGAQLQGQPKTTDTGDPLALYLWANLFEDCANGQNTQETTVCPSTGQLDLGPRTDANGGLHELYAPCVPGTVDPLEPSLVSPEALLGGNTPSGGNDVVESAPITLPQTARRSRSVRTPRLRTIDCTDPANVGRGDCAGTNRQNKPLSLPEGN